MKRLLTLAMSLLSLSVAAQTVAGMNELNAVQKAAATNVKLTGKLSTGGNSDFRQLRDLCYQLRSIDLGSADCEAIPNNAFHSRHVLEQVVLPENVRTIGSQAFFACTALNSIELPKTLTRVGDAAFSGCTKLRDITINGTPTLGEFAFARLSGLRTLRVNSAVPPVASASTFEGIDRKKVKLVVPRGSEMKYRRAEGWNRFFGTPDNDNRLCNPAEALVPVPAHLEMTGGNPLSVNRLWEVMAADGLANECVQAERLLRERLPKVKNPVIAGKATLTLGIDTSLADDEAYTLVVSEKGVTIQGRTARGVFYGLMTSTSCCVATAHRPAARAFRSCA